MSKTTKENKLLRVVFSPFITSASTARKIAYIAVMTALSVACNMFFEIKLGDVQFSFTFAVSALIGLLIGGGVGFVACFIGDLLGFLSNTGGFAYMPWIGLSSGTVALISGIVFHLFTSNKTWVLYVKIAIISILSFLICTVGINTVSLWALYSQTDYFTYLTTRLFVLGGIYNSIVNYFLLFVIIPAIKRVSFFKNLNI